MHKFSSMDIEYTNMAQTLADLIRKIRPWFQAFQRELYKEIIELESIKNKILSLIYGDSVLPTEINNNTVQASNGLVDRNKQQYEEWQNNIRNAGCNPYYLSTPGESEYTDDFMGKVGKEYAQIMEALEKNSRENLTLYPPIFPGAPMPKLTLPGRSDDSISINVLVSSKRGIASLCSGNSQVVSNNNEAFNPQASSIFSTSPKNNIPGN
jgi:hypothetical protein